MQTEFPFSFSNQNQNDQTSSIKNHPRECLETSQHLNNKAVNCIHTGDTENAESFLKQSLSALAFDLCDVKSCKKVFKSQKKSHHNIDDYDEGISKFLEPIMIMEEENIPCSSALLISIVLYNLGQVSLRRGKDPNNKKAEEYFQSALIMALRWEIKQTTLSKTLCVFILHNIGYIQNKFGQHEDSMKSYSKALCVARSVFGSCHLYVANALNSMGSIQFNMEEADEKQIMELFSEALGILNMLGNQHVHVATTLNNMGRLQYMNGNFVTSINIYNEALKMRFSVLGKDNLDVAATSYNLAQTYEKVHINDLALKHYGEFVRIVQLHLGENRYDIMTALKRMGQIHHSEKRIDMAMHFFVKSLEVGRKTLGDEHVEIASILNRIGSLHYERDDFESALESYNQGLEIERSVSCCFDKKCNYLNLIVTLKNIGQIHRIRGDYEHALNHYREVYDIMKKFFKPGSSEDIWMISDALSDISLMYYLMGNSVQSFYSYQEVLCLRREAALGHDHIKIAATLSSIGTVMSKQGLTRSAVQTFKECLRIRRSLLGDHHADVAETLFNIATVSYEQGDEDEAIKYYKETLRVERNALGEDNDDFIFTLECLGNAHDQRGEVDDALEYFNESLKIQQRKNPHEDNFNSTKLTLNQIGNLHLKKGDVCQAMEAYSEALRLERRFGIQGEIWNEFLITTSDLELYMMSKLHPECAAAA